MLALIPGQVVFLCWLYFQDRWSFCAGSTSRTGGLFVPALLPGQVGLFRAGSSSRIGRSFLYWLYFQDR